MLPLPGMNQFHQGFKHVISAYCPDIKQDDLQTPPSRGDQIEVFKILNGYENIKY